MTTPDEFAKAGLNSADSEPIVGNPESGYDFWVLTNYKNDVTVKMSFKQ